MIKNGKSAIALLLTLILIGGMLSSCGNEKISFVKGDKQFAYYYIDTKGDIVSENCFKIADYFNEDGVAYVTAYVGKENNYTEVEGYIDKNCEFVGGKYWESKEILDSYEEQMGNGLLTIAISENDGELVIMDTTGNELAIIDNVEEAIFVGPSDNGYVAFCNRDGKYGFIDKNCNIIINPIYTSVGPFINGYAWAKYNGKEGLIDEYGNWVIEPQYKAVFYGGDGTFFRAQIDEDDYIYINTKNEPLNDKVYHSDNSRCIFEEGLCSIYDDESGLIGFMNESGEYVIEPQFDDAFNFQNGIAAVCKIVNGEKLWGYIDKEGKDLVDYKYNSAGGFSEEGIALVKYDGKYGYINKDGSWFLKPQFEDACSFSNGYAAVRLYDGQTIEK